MHSARARQLRFGYLTSVALPGYAMQWLYAPWSYGFPPAQGAPSAEARKNIVWGGY